MKWNEFIGQEEIKTELVTILKSRLPIPHILFYGGWGMGKTTLAKLVAERIGLSSYHVGTQKSISFSDYYDVHVIDEIHSLSRPEELYPIMENKVFMGCTTKIGAMDLPLRSRFVEFVFRDYSNEEIMKIVKVATKSFRNLSDGALNRIAIRSRGVPRTAINLAYRLIRYCRVHKLEFTPVNIDKMCEYFGIDEKGFTIQDMKYLDVLKNINRPIGLTTLSALTGIDKNTLTLVIEPFLLKEGLITVTSSGRTLL